jgi:hypothetical protein
MDIRAGPRYNIVSLSRDLLLESAIGCSNVAGQVVPADRLRALLTLTADAFGESG